MKGGLNWFVKNKGGDDRLCTDYHARIKAEFLFTLLMGEAWPCEVLDHTFYKSKRTKPIRHIGLLGYEKVGKSHLAAKIMKKKIPNGMTLNTVGLCLFYPVDEDMPFAILDTPGTNTAVQLEKLQTMIKTWLENRKIEEQKLELPKERVTESALQRFLSSAYGNDVTSLAYLDNNLMENIYQEFVISVSQVIIVVIGDALTREQQTLISRLQKKGDKQLLIVHNLKSLKTMEEVKTTIEKLRRCMCLNIRDVQIDPATGKKALVFIDMKENRCEQTEHIIIAKEGSVAGKILNKPAYNYLRSKINVSQKKDEPFDIFEKFFKWFEENLDKNLMLRSDIEFNPESEGKIIIRYSSNNVPSELRLKDPSRYELKLGLNDALGRLITLHPNKIMEIPYTTKIVQNNDTEQWLLVEFEMSSTVEDLICIPSYMTNDNSYVRIRITGTSVDNVQREPNVIIRSNSRRFGKFLLETDPIDLGGLCLDLAEEPENLDGVPKGLVVLRWKLKWRRYR